MTKKTGGRKIKIHSRFQTLGEKLKKQKKKHRFVVKFSIESVAQYTLHPLRVRKVDWAVG